MFRTKTHHLNGLRREPFLTNREEKAPMTRGKSRGLLLLTKSFSMDGDATHDSQGVSLMGLWHVYHCQGTHGGMGISSAFKLTQGIV